MRRDSPLVAAIRSVSSPDDLRRTKLMPHQELVELREGRGTTTSWHTVTGRLNFGAVLSQLYKFTDDPQQVLGRALDAIRSLEARHKEIGRYVLTGEELKAIGAGLTLTDDLHDATTWRQHREAMRVMLAKFGK